MNKFSKKLVSIITGAVVAAGFVTPVTNTYATTKANISLEDDVEKASVPGGAPSSDNYATNPDGQVGKEKTINSASDFTEDMIIAQGVANDDPAIFRGSHEAPKFDQYALYAAWDDSNLYIGVQYTNVIDVVDPAQQSPQTGRGKPNGADADIPQMLLFDLGSGDYTDGSTNDTKQKTVWDTNVTFGGDAKVDKILMYSPKEGINNFGLFSITDGVIDYSKDVSICPGYQMPLPGATVTWEDGFFGSKMTGINANGYAGYKPDDLESSSSNWCDFLAQGHSKEHDTFCIITLSYDLLGISKSQIENEGIGLMTVSTYGESGIGCLPMDMVMLDNACDPYGSDDSTSHEKDDADQITVPLARVGKGGGGPVIKKPVINSFSSDLQSPQNVGTSINFSASATSENGAVTYEYKVDGTTVQAYSSKSTFEWTPSAAGTYKITVTAKDTAGKTASKDLTYVIEKSIVVGPSISSFKPNVQSPQNLGTNITFTTTATGTGLTYKYYVDGSLEDSGSNRFVWSPISEGTYTIKVVVTDSNGQKAEKSVSYTINKPVSSFKITKITPSIASSQAIVGNSVKFTTASSGASGQAQYRFRIKSGTTVVAQSTISTATSYTWKPSKAGTYTVEVFAQDDDSNQVTKRITYVVKSAIVNPLKITSFTTSVASPQAVGKKITMSASATGSGTIKYQFYAYLNGTLVSKSSCSTTKTYAWTPSKSGTYTLKVVATDGLGKVVSTKKTYKITNSELKITSFTTSVASPQQVGKTITLSAAAKGSGTVRYHFYAYLNGKVVQQSALSTAKTYSWKPTKAGTYTLKVVATDSTGKIVSTTKSYVVKAAEPITITSLTSSVASPQNAGKSIKFTTKATGKTTLQYQYWVCNVDGSWTKLKSYSTTATATWKPTVSGDYIIWVDVKDTKGNVKSKYVTYKINPQVTKIEESYSGITYTGTWKDVSVTNASGGKIKRATSTAKASFSFTGTGVKMYAAVGSNMGMAKVTVDGTSYMVDLYASSSANKKGVFTKTGLTNTKHTVTIEYLGLGNLNSTGTAINIDYFELIK